MVTDPIADFLTRIRNAAAAGRKELTMPHSQMKLSIAELLVREGFLKSAARRGKKVKKYLDLEIALHDDGKPVITGGKRISKPGKRLYYKVAEIQPVKYGHGIMVLSTPRGILSDKEARKAKVGGEALLSIW
jgi:small subunit ribosomal protein S8